jgi:hypothetical protein
VSNEQPKSRVFRPLRWDNAPDASILALNTRNRRFHRRNRPSVRFWKAKSLECPECSVFKANLAMNTNQRLD